MSRIRIGISGWRYPPWRGTFYPPDLAQKDELRYAAGLMNTIEINGSFYSLQWPKSYARWYADAAAGFVFSVKAPRYITHIRRLHDIRAPLANFFASGVLALREKLGPILWQFPARYRFHAEVFEEFLALLPRYTARAAALGAEHDDKLKRPPYLTVDRTRRIRHTVEVRNETFFCEEFFTMLRKRNIALVFSDGAGHWPSCFEVTADFSYLRLHGGEELYSGAYSPAAMTAWARKIRAWHAGSAKDGKGATPGKRSRDVYLYFDNTSKTHAPMDALRMLKRLKTATPEALERLNAGDFEV